jgi:uncharacterized protein (DUF488 family)
MADSAPIVFTIGFTQTSAKDFFARLSKAGVKNILDVRLHNTSQLAGFAKADDLAFFLNRIGNIGYQHVPLLAPEDEMLSDYKKKKGAWSEYEQRFLTLMSERKIEDKLDLTTLDGACLLCSEHAPHHCHRRLVCDYLNTKWDNRLSVRHL